jgi:hypothetical protein
MRPALSLVALLVTAYGCVGTEAPPDPEENSRVEEPRETVFDPWVETIDRARGVQRTIDEAEAERRRQLEEAER